MDHFDVAIVGAGVTGLAVAQRLSSSTSTQKLSTVVLEQETGFGQQISSRNSEVIHAGIYYAAGSLKAQLCVRGNSLLIEYCQRFNVPFNLIGKYIVSPREGVDELERLRQRALLNGVEDLRWIDEKALVIAEPNVSAYCALYSPSSGIVNSHSFMLSLLHSAEANGTLFSPRTRVLKIHQSNYSFQIECEIGDQASPTTLERYRFNADKVINCAGLNATKVANCVEGIDASTIPKLHLCKGDYFSYSGKSPFTHLIYPLPEANNIGLGIHATLDLNGRVRFGPDAEYIHSAQFDIDSNKAGDFAARIANYFPAIKMDDLQPDYAGVRPKLSAAGEPAADFMIQDVTGHQIPGLIQLFGIESPGLTASLAIAEKVVELMQQQ